MYGRYTRCNKQTIHAQRKTDFRTTVYNFTKFRVVFFFFLLTLLFFYFFVCTRHAIYTYTITPATFFSLKFYLLIDIQNITFFFFLNLNFIISPKISCYRIGFFFTFLMRFRSFLFVFDSNIVFIDFDILCMKM